MDGRMRLTLNAWVAYTKGVMTIMVSQHFKIARVIKGKVTVYPTPKNLINTLYARIINTENY